MFIILPAILISAEFITSQLSKLNRKYLVLGLVGFAMLVIVGFLVNYEVVPLNPKEAYIEKVRDLDFNFLIPLTGGSGPIGFYASAQFILWTWFACAVGLFMNRRRWAIYLFLIFGLGYNVFLSSEFLFGSLYGSVNKITKQSVDYVLNNDDIDEVITYYDAGVYYLRMNEKYNGRFYTAPSRDYAPKLTIYRGHYLIVDFPAIDKKSKYWELISRCAIDIKFTDKYVDSYIFDCSRVPVASLDKST